MAMSGFEDFMSQQLRGNRPVNKPIHEAQIMELRVICAQYQEPCAFKVGDLVTPRAGRGIRDAGEPHIVVEVFDPPRRVFDGDASIQAYVALITMRVACISGGGEAYVCFSVEHPAFERYTGEGA